MKIKQQTPEEAATAYAMENSSFCQMSDHSAVIDRAFYKGIEWARENPDWQTGYSVKGGRYNVVREYDGKLAVRADYFDDYDSTWENYHGAVVAWCKFPNLPEFTEE